MRTPFSPLYCSTPVEALYAYGSPIPVAVDSDPQKPLARELVWVPAGEHEIYAHGADMQPVQARVLCDEASARGIIAHFDELRASGKRVWLDKNHEDAEATADVRGFAWDPARGIVATVDWTPYGERLLRDRVFCSFSPAFLRNKATGRPAMLMVGKSAGGLVNAPAFGAAMPALIAARLAGAELPATTAPAGSAGDSSASTPAMNKELLIKLLAALGVVLAPDADAVTTDAAITQALAKSQDSAACAAAGAKPNPELETLRAQLATVRKDRAKAAVDSAVARGALPAKDEAIQAKWMGLIQADPTHEALLAALPGNAALERKTQPGAGIIQVRDGAVDVLRALAATSIADTAKRSEIYGRDIAPLFDSGAQLGPILAANSLGTLSGEIVTQRSLSLLKFSFPWLKKISTDFTADAVAYNTAVKTRLRTVPALANFVAGTGYARQNAGTTDVSVTINNHKGCEIAFNANELANTGRDLFGEQVEGAHYAIGKGLTDTLLALITVANFANESVEATADVDADTCDTLDAALSGRGVVGPRIGLFSSAVYRKLGKDASIVALATYKHEEIITQGRLPMIKNIDPYEVFTLPTPAGENLTGFAGTADALALATRVPNDYSKVFGDVASNGVVQIVTNPDTGISVMLVRYIDHKAGEAAWRVALMWGGAVGNASAGQRLISAARA